MNLMQSPCFALSYQIIDAVQATVVSMQTDLYIDDERASVKLVAKVLG